LSVEGRAYSLAIADGRLLVSTDRGVVHCFEQAGGDTPSDQAIKVREHTELAPGAAPAATEQDQQLAAAVLKRKRLRRGYILVADGDLGLVAALAQQGEARVIALAADDKQADRLRQGLTQRGLYGRAVVHVGRREKLPYGPAIFDLVVCRSTAAPREVAELTRVTRPGGAVYVPAAAHPSTLTPPKTKNGAATSLVTIAGKPWRRIEPRPAAGGGEWTHIYANPANTACSGDKIVSGPAFDLQWFGQPGPREMIDRHHRPPPPLAVGARLFVPGDNRLFGVNAYNGAVLWEQELPGSRRVAMGRDTGGMAAAADRVYVACGEKCLALDVETGQSLQQHPTPAAADGSPRHWGYVATVGDRLFGSATRPGASRSGHSRRQINETYWDFKAVVTSQAVFAHDRKKPNLLWRYEAQGGAIVNSTITIGGGRMFFVESRNIATLDSKTGRSTLADLLDQGADVVALDLASGKVAWRKSHDLNRLDHYIYMMYAGERLVIVGTKNKKSDRRATVWFDTLAFDARDGKPLWSASQDQRQGTGGDHGEQDRHPAIVGDTVYVEPYAYDLATGKQRPNWRFLRGGHGCGSISASAAAIFFRAGNPTLCDLATGARAKVTQVSRPGCWINIIPAGGLLLIPEASSGCTCNFSIQASLALRPRPTDADCAPEPRRN